MAVEVYGIDATYVASFFPQIEVSLTASITPTTLAVMIVSAAGRVNSILRAHGIQPETLATDTASDAYTATRALIITCIAPHIDRALLADPTASEAECDAKIDAFEKMPQMLAAGGSDPNVSPSVNSSTAYHSIVIDDATLKSRRSYGVGFKGW